MLPRASTRTLDVPTVQGGEWTGAGAFGGSWIDDNFTLMGGARVDANVFTAAPLENQSVSSLFGMSTDHAPNAIAISPRLGFTWRPSGYRGAGAYGTQVSNLYKGAQQLRGGIGLFRNTLSPTLLSGAMQSTGLPGGARQLECIGPAAPVPNWQGYASDQSTIPNQCVGTSAFADTVPQVRLFDRAFCSQRELARYARVDRPDLRPVSRHRRHVRAQSASARKRRSQLSRSTPRFVLANEANRPIFVTPANIVPSTGAESPVDARVSSAFGSVFDRVSELRGDSRQLTVYTIPSIPWEAGLLTIGYTYQDARSQSRGFDQTTASDPRAVTWAPAPVPHHQFVFQGARIFHDFALTMTGRVSSGIPFTPVVAGDLNGDGLSNDRAFVFNPAATTDTALASGLRNLLAGSPARSCLQHQIGQIAAQSSCTGPWSATMNASIALFPYVPGSHDRATARLTLSNVLGGVDQLVHGGDHLHGWGATPFPDQTLYQVRGFDPATQQFLYTVNPRFGSASPATTTLRVPFRITLDVSIDIGHSAADQMLDQNLRVRPSLIGTRANADTIKKRYTRFFYGDLYRALLMLSDSLALSVDQMEKMQQRRLVLLARQDSIYTALAAYLAALPDGFDHNEALQRSTDADYAAWATVIGERTFLPTLFTPGQMRLLPPDIIRMIIDPY